MNIENTFERIYPREFSGQNTFRSYRFQAFFAANLLLEMLKKKNADGMILLDYFDDVVFIDNSNLPTLIHFYQVKTNKECKISISTVINKEFLAKMAWNLEQFKENNCCATFVTNGTISVNFASIKNDLHIKGYSNFSFSDISPITITNLLSSHEMSEEAMKIINEHLPAGVSADQIYFLKTDFSFDDFERDFLGKITDYFADSSPYYSAVEIRAITNSIIERIEEKQGQSFNPITLSFDEIKTKKGIKVIELENIIKNISMRYIPKSFDDLYDFSINYLHFDFDGKNIVLLSQLYSQYKIDYVQSNIIINEIINYMKSIDISSASNDSLFAYYDEMLKNSRFYKNYIICQKYHQIIVVVLLYKIVKEVEI